MADSIALDIVQAMETRLEAILTASGYNTDAGSSVSIGRRRFNDEELDDNPVLTIYDTSDEVVQTAQYMETDLQINLTVVVEGYIKRASAVEISTTAHQLLADIKEAMLLTDITLGGLAFAVYYDSREIEYPEEGSEVASVSVRFTVFYRETYGDPYG